MKGIAKGHICIANGHRQQCGEGQREGRVRTGWRWAKGGRGYRTSVIVSRIYIKYA